MVRSRFFAAFLNILPLLLVVFAVLPQQALAQETIRVRGGEHQGYSRIVFDWNSPVKYTVKNESPTHLLLSFDKAGSLNLSGAGLSNLKYIDNVQEVSKQPLVVRISVPSDAGHKHFLSGHKVALDVLQPKPKPPQATPQAEPKSQTKPDPTPAAEPAPQAAISPKPEIKPETPEESSKPTAQEETLAPPPSDAVLKAPEETAQANMAAADEKPSEPPPSQAAQAQEQQEPEPTPDAPKLITEAATRNLPSIDKQSDKPNLIALSSVSPTNMAVFELYNDLWLVNDKQEYLISPQVTGDQRDIMQPIETVANPEAKTFKLKALKDADFLVQGGGLVWRVLVGNKLENNKAIKPTRQTSSAKIRDGKVIWPFEEIGEIIDVKDPVSGVTLKIVTVGRSEDYAGPAMEFVDFKTLRSPLGLAIWPKTDDLVVEKTEEGVVIHRPNGLALTQQVDIDLAAAAPRVPDDKALDSAMNAPTNQLFNFVSWQLGGRTTMHDNTILLLSRIPGLGKSGQAESLLNLAKMYVANGVGAEAMGFLDIAVSILPEMEASPEFKAIKGVALALTDRNEEAFRLLSDEKLANRTEILNWRSYTLARLQDWQQAESLLPADFSTIQPYPAEIAIPLTLILTEVALRSGDLGRAGELFAIATRHERAMNESDKAALTYLKGEAARQDGNIDEAISQWKQIAENSDDLYRVKAGLALTRLEYEQKKLSLADAVDRLEMLRYAWRGDDLEAQVNYWLGHIYFEAGDYVKGLNMMRDAASFSTGPELGKRIIAEMSEEFQNLFLGEHLDKLPAPDAVAIYERFSELNPGDEKGDKIAQKLVDRLVKANLYEKALQILSYQLDSRLQGEDAFKAAKRLALIHLLNNAPSKALETLDKADSLRAAIPVLAENADIGRDLIMLRARAMSESSSPARALALLRSIPATPDNNRLYADIAWKHSYWSEAALALQNVIEDKGITLSNPLPSEHAELVLQRAVALNLADDRIRLASMRETYSEAMGKTPRGHAFEVITRPRQSAELADRQTLLSLSSEVSLFSSLLEEYQKQAEQSEQLNQSNPAPSSADTPAQ